MNCNIEFKNLAAQKTIQQLIKKLITRIEKKIKGLSPDATFLRLRVEENSVRKLYHVSVALELPGKTFPAKEEKRDLQTAVRDAFAEIERQVKKYKSTTRNEPEWKRPARRQELREMNLAAVPDEQRNRELFFSLAAKQLHRLYEFVRHKLAYSESAGDLVRGELTPEDVLDAVLLRAYREFVKRPARGDTGKWLTELATQYLASETKRLKAERALTVRIEEDVPETPPAEEVITLGEEILDFYQPDEDLKLEDILPDLKIPPPDRIVETKELRRCVNTALAGLPEEWRRALWLRHVKDLTGRELAKASGKPEAEIERILDYALRYVRQKLVESGCKFEEGDARARGPHAADVASDDALQSEKPKGDGPRRAQPAGRSDARRE
jgi:ribosomal subunit interface protein